MDELTPIQIRILCLLASGKTKKEIYDITEVSSATIDRLSKNLTFKSKLREITTSVYDAALAELCNGAVIAAIELNKIIENPETPAKVKISAISTLFTHAGKAKDFVLQDRLEKIELLLNEDNVIEVTAN